MISTHSDAMVLAPMLTPAPATPLAIGTPPRLCAAETRRLWQSSLPRAIRWEPVHDCCTPSRCSTSRSASSPPTEERNPPPKRAMLGLPPTGDRPGSDGVVSTVAGAGSQGAWFREWHPVLFLFNGLHHDRQPSCTIPVHCRDCSVAECGDHAFHIDPYRHSHGHAAPTA